MPDTWPAWVEGELRELVGGEGRAMRNAAEEGRGDERSWLGEGCCVEGCWGNRVVGRMERGRRSRR